MREILELLWRGYTFDEDRELSLSTLENDVMVVDLIESNDVWLREGNSE
jgi:hypothetical protein